jgi:hypothetical protein
VRGDIEQICGRLQSSLAIFGGGVWMYDEAEALKSRLPDRFRERLSVPAHPVQPSLTLADSLSELEIYTSTQRSPQL